MIKVLHDFLLVKGGAERLVLTLSEGLQSPLITGFVDPSLADWAKGKAITALGSPVNGLALRYFQTAHRFSNIHEHELRADTVVYSGVLSLFAATRQTTGRRIHYCHSPPRFLYDLQDYYLAQSGPLKRVGLQLVDAWLRPRYEAALQEMDIVVANSKNVARRLKHYLSIDATVVYPPIDTKRFRWIEDGDYFLSLARLEDYKRIDIIIEAFRQLPEMKLVIASGGNMELKFRKLAAECPNIAFTSWLDDHALANLIGRARAVIYIPIDEDFGMSPVEAMAAGKPVIGVSEGGLLETVVAGETGILLDPCLNPEILIDAVGSLSSKQCIEMREACEKQASCFSTEGFIQRMKAVIDSTSSYIDPAHH